MKMQSTFFVLLAAAVSSCAQQEVSGDELIGTYVYVSQDAGRVHEPEWLTISSESACIVKSVKSAPAVCSSWTIMRGHNDYVLIGPRSFAIIRRNDGIQLIEDSDSGWLFEKTVNP